MNTQSLETGFCLIPENMEGGIVAPVWQVEPARHRIVLIADCREDTQHSIRALEPRLMHLLCLLASEPGDVVRREVLIDALWPNVIVNENSLNRAVSDLRRALDIGQERWIETVPKRGYRLCAQVELAERTAAADGQYKGPSTLTTTVPEPGIAGSAVSDALWRQWLPAAAAALLLALSLMTQLHPEQLTDSQAQPLATRDSEAAVYTDRVLEDHSGFGAAEILDGSYSDSAAWEARPAIANMLLGDKQDGSATLGEPINAANAERSATTELAIIVPEHHLMAYVDKQQGVSQLKLRNAFLEDTSPWVAFTTEEQIQHLQWSPLDDGLLFTVITPAKEPNDMIAQRLMLLDIETLSLHELYRRNRHPDQGNNNGKLT